MTISTTTRRLTGSLRTFVLSVVLLIGLSPGGVMASAVDEYTQFQLLIDKIIGGSGESLSVSDLTTILGEERDLNVNSVDGLVADSSRSVVLIDGGVLSFSSDTNVVGTAIAQWDGVDGVTQLPPALPQFGLNTDLTQGGTFDALEYDVLAADKTFSYRIEAYTDTDHYSRMTIQQSAIAGDPVTVTLPYQDFLDCDNVDVECGPGGPVDFEQLGALQLLLNTDSVSALDMSMSPIRTVLISAQLGDFVWHDLDNDGIQDDNEPGIENVVVKLLACVGDPLAPGGELKQTTTDADGLYLFDNLTPGDYAVVFVAPDGYVFSPADQGTDDALDSDVVYISGNTGGTACVTLGSGDINLTVDAGLYLPPAGLGDRVWEDKNANGIQENGEPGIPDVTVNLLLPGNDGICNTGDDLLEESTTTDGTGIYAFNDLVPGRYCVEFVKPAICDPVIGGESAFSPANQGTDDTVDSDADTATGKTGNIDLDPDEFDDTNDAGVYCPAKIGDFVWNDYNENGIQDDGEAAIPGVEVNLLDCDDNNQVVGNMVTDADGMYMFNPLMPGNYALEFIAPDGYVFTQKNAGNDPAVDSDASPGSGITDCTELESNEYDDTWDAGLYLPKQPGIDIEKATNGVDADFPDTGDAPQVAPGDPVAWTYVVTNTGDTTLYDVTVVDDQGVAVSCPKTELAPGESMTCTAEGYAVDLTDTGFTTVPGVCGDLPNKPLYENQGTATGETITGEPVEDVDPSHYCNPEEEEHGRISPTGTTCEDFVNERPLNDDGLPVNLASFDMTVFKGKISNVSNPGAAFYFTRFTTSGDVTVDIVQESTGGFFYEMDLSTWQLFEVVDTGSGLECDILEQDKFAKPLQTDESVDLLDLPPAEYAMRIRMEPKSIQGETDPGTDLRNDFRTEIDGSVVDRDPDGVILKRIEK